VDYEVVWTEPAGADLEAILQYIAQDNPSAAAAMRLEFLERTEQLQQLPLIGAVYERDRGGRTREINCRSYRIFYRVDDARKRVEILTVWHGARKEPTMPD
jgi:plasmid stabilization system protein ParE